MYGNHQNGNVREHLCDAPGDIKSVEIRHLEVQQNHVGRIFLDTFQYFAAGSRFATYSPGALQLQQAAKIMPHRRVIICHQDSNQAGPSFLPCFYLVPTIVTGTILFALTIKPANYCPQYCKPPSIANSNGHRSAVLLYDCHQIPLSLPVIFQRRGRG